MNTDESLDVIRALADGIDPSTGLDFPSNSPFLLPKTIRALFAAIQALEQVSKPDEGKKNILCNAGKPWVKAEDKRLIAEFDSGRSIKLLAEKHKRTEGSIQARLVKHGKINP